MVQSVATASLARRLVWLALPALVGTSACAATAPAVQTQQLSLDVNGTTRWTLVYAPPGYRAGAPVVLLLHGGGQSMRKAVSERGGGTRHWLTIAARENFLLLVPNATNADSGDPNGDKQNWNDLRPDDATDQTKTNDVGFLVHLLDWAKQKYGYDPRRVYVTGASNGGMMTMRLVLEQPQRFTAAAAFIASLPDIPPPKPGTGIRVPLMLFNGTRDPLVQWQGGEIRGGRGKTMPIEAMVQWWREVNGVASVVATPETLPDRDPEDGCRIERTLWSAKSQNTATVVFYRADGGGHALPSIDHPLRLGPIARRLIGPVCRDAEGAELAWHFFSRHGPVDKQRD